MNTNRQLFRNNTSTFATDLRGIARVDSHHLNTSFFRFVFKKLPQLTQTCIMRRSGKVSIVIHKRKRQIFDSNQVEFPNQMVCDLVQIISALIGNLFMQGGDSRISLLLPLTVFRLASGVPLQTAQLQKIFFQPTRIIDQFSSRESKEIFQTQVYANLFVRCLMQRNLFWQLHHEAYIPVSYTHLRAHETRHDLVCRLLLEKN